MPTRRAFIASAPLLLCATPLAAQTSPPRGSPVRTELMNALRPRVQAEVGGKVEFTVRTLRFLDPWAFMHVVPQRPDGSGIDWNRTKFAQDMRDGNMTDGTMALLHRSGTQWRVVELAVGPSDLPWDGWIKPHKVPRRLFTDE